MDARRAIDDAIGALRPPDAAAREAARQHQLRLTKPAGALGRIEALAVWAAGVCGTPSPALRRKVIVVAAADHGVAARGVSAYPQEVTRQMVANFLAGGAAVNVLASHVCAEVRIVDAGVRGGVADGRLHVAKLRECTDDITQGPAMTRDEAETLVARGIWFAFAECAAGADALALGDMGIGNTTVAAAITSALAGLLPAVTVGRGTGVDDRGFAAKLRVVERALEVNRPEPSDGIDVLAKVGGFELAFLAGVAIGGTSRSVPVVLDGYPTTAAALVAATIAPTCVDHLLASHVSAEPGHRFALEHLGLRPLLDLEMRLGEGTGAALALSLLEAALRIPREMATFVSAGVSRSAGELPPER